MIVQIDSVSVAEADHQGAGAVVCRGRRHRLVEVVPVVDVVVIVVVSVDVEVNVDVVVTVVEMVSALV